MREKVVTGLSATGKPVFWQKLISGGIVPEQYFIFNTMTTEDGFSDDEAHDRERYVYLEYYSTTDISETFIESIRAGMKAQGFLLVDERDTSNEHGYQYSMTWHLLEAM